MVISVTFKTVIQVNETGNKKPSTITVIYLQPVRAQKCVRDALLNNYQL